jgi:hypothetical protein
MVPVAIDGTGWQMKCHAGVEFESGKPCPKCHATLGEVCWPGINADLLELPRLRKALESIIREAAAIKADPNWPGEAMEVADRLYKIAALALPSRERS